MASTAFEYPQKPVSGYEWAMLGIFGAVFVWSALHPHDYFTWFMETFPAMVALVVLCATYRRFRFTPLIYTLICIHAIILFIGGHYTYALTPIGEWMKPLLHTPRNDFDKIGHFAQGFVPAMVVREVLWRRKIVVRKGWLIFIVVCICLAISAAYELFEFATAVLEGSKADDFLGTQGDPWDTQKDMLTALVGAISAMILLPRLQDKQTARLMGNVDRLGAS